MRCFVPGDADPRPDQPVNVRWSTRGAQSGWQENRLASAARNSAAVRDKKGPSHDRPFDERIAYSRNSASDIQTLPLQNFTQAAQTFNLNRRTRSRVRPIHGRRLPVSQLHTPVNRKTTCQHFTLFGVQFEQPFDDALFHVIVLRGVFRAVVFFIGQISSSAESPPSVRQLRAYRAC